MNTPKWSVNRNQLHTWLVIGELLFAEATLFFTMNLKRLPQGMAFGFIVVLLFLIGILWAHNAHCTIKMATTFLIASIFVGIGIISPYGVLYLAKEYGIVFLLLITYHASILNKNSYKTINQWFYWSMICFLGYSLLVDGRISPDVVFTGIRDKNYTALYVSLFFLYCFYFRRIFGILLCIPFLLFMTGSRGAYGFITLCLLFSFLRNPLHRFLQFFKITKAWKAITILFIGSMILSVFWIHFIAINQLDSYRQGLNDGSNKMRFAANIYAMEKVLNEPELCIMGYGRELLTTWGINPEVTKNMKEHQRYLGVRLVQPHNSILNLMMRIGIIPTLLYVYLLDKLINKFWSPKTEPLILSYMIYACFMHSFYDSPWLIIWITILFLQTKSEKMLNYNGNY